MTVRHLKIFITVVDCGKMRKAAEELYISQPSVSQAIAELESYYGIKVFERLAQKIYLTEQGEILLQYARHVVDSFEKMDLAMKHTGMAPILRIGGSVSVGTCMLNDLVTEMEASLPKLDIRVTINNTGSIEQMVLKSELDLAIVEGVVESKNIKQIPLLSDELVIVVGKSHPFYKKSSIVLDDLEGQRVIAREDGSSNRNQYEQFLMENDIKVNPIWKSSNTEPIKKAVISGKGLTFISRMLVAKEVEEGQLRIVPVNGVKINREIQLIYHKDKYISQVMETFILIAKDSFRR